MLFKFKVKSKKKKENVEKNGRFNIDVKKYRMVKL